MADNILSDFGINLLEEEVDDVIFQTNEFLCDASRHHDGKECSQCHAHLKNPPKRTL